MGVRAPLLIPVRSPSTWTREDHVKYQNIHHEVDVGSFAPLGRKGEPLFVLRGQDLLAPVTVMFYAAMRLANGDKKGARECERIAADMLRWSDRKMPD